MQIAGQQSHLYDQPAGQIPPSFYRRSITRHYTLALQNPGTDDPDGRLHTSWSTLLAASGRIVVYWVLAAASLVTLMNLSNLGTAERVTSAVITSIEQLSARVRAGLKGFRFMKTP